MAVKKKRKRKSPVPLPLPERREVKLLTLCPSKVYKFIILQFYVPFSLPYVLSPFLHGQAM